MKIKSIIVLIYREGGIIVGIIIQDIRPNDKIIVRIIIQDIRSNGKMKIKSNIMLIHLGIGWLLGCFSFNGPLRQYFSLYRAVSQRDEERGEKG